MSALPNSVLGKLIGRDELRMDEYFNRALGAILQAAKSDRSCMPARLALTLRNCHIKHMAEMGGEHLHKEMAPCLLPLPPSPPPPFPPALPSPPELPPTPEAQQQRGSVAQSQTPLQLLAEQATFQLPLRSQEGQEQQQQPFLEYQSPAGPFDPVAVAGFANIRAGDTALGLGGPVRDVVTDDSFWGGPTGSGGVGMWLAVASQGWRF